MAQKSALINVMVKAAQAAAKSLKRDFLEVEHLQVSRKGTADFVSTADFASQKILREELSKARPNFGFIMEEKDGAPDSSGKSERWIVDPLDGTTNFLHALPHWAISIGVEREGELVAGVVYDPIKDEMFWAEKGLGAYCNNKRIRVSARKELLDCLIGTGIPFAGVEKDATGYTKQMQAIMLKVAGIRRWGAAALDLAYVAAGRYDGFWESGLHPYDVAAGIVIVKEAGGFVSPLEAGKSTLFDGQICASNTAIHETVLKLLRSA